MASVYADPKLRSKRTYIATSSFNNQLYTYTTAMSPTTYKTTGALGATTGATAATCPQGHLLRENGARLYPEANPGISTLMVGVFDASSGLKGYIDPNAPIFAVFNSDKPVEMVDGGDNNTATAHKGQPVYTSGDVIAVGGVTAQTGDITAQAGYVAGTVNLGTASTGSVFTGIVSDGGAGNLNVSADPRTGNSFIATFNSGGIASTKIVYVYFGPGATQVAPPAGEMVSLVLVNNSGNAINVTFNQVTPNVVVGSGNVGTNGFLTGTKRVWTFVSDGTNLYQVSSATY